MIPHADPPVKSLGSFTEQALSELKQHLAAEPVDAKRIQGLSGGLISYDQITADVNITHTTEGTADTVITGSSGTYNGADPVLIQFFAPSWTTAVNNTALHIVLLEGSTVLGEIADDFSGGAGAFRQIDGFYRFTPTAGSHAYKIAAYGTNLSTTKIKANSGGAGTFLPAFLRITYDT